MAWCCKLHCSGSIKDNVKWGREDATDEEVVAAAEAAQAHDFIMSLPEKYATQLGQRGVNLSGGQKQRLAIARALIKRPPILVFDDSTSAVDMGTEARIHKALKDVAKNSTCFVIAQRISTVLHADKIMVLEDGEIEALGAHEELLRTSPVYQDIYHSQVREGGQSQSHGKAKGPPPAIRPGGGGRHRHLFGPEAKAKDIRGTGKRLWSYFQHQRKPLALVFLLVLAASALNLVSPFLIGRAIDNYIVPRDFNGLARISAVMVAVYALAAVITWVQQYTIVVSPRHGAPAATNCRQSQTLHCNFRP